MALFGLLAGLLVPMLLSLIPLLLVIIGQAKTNNKAGRPGWHAIIPFLSQYTRAAIGGNVKNFWMLLASIGISFVLSILGTVLNEALGQTIALIIALTSLPFGIAAIVFAIKIENGVARAFGKGKGFTAGLILLPLIFNPILGFGNAEYNGEIPEKPVQTPKEPKAKKEKTPKPAKTPKTKKEKPAKNQQTPAVHPEPEEEVEPPRPEFKPQYDMGDTESEEAPATPRMTMDQMMLQSLKAKKAPPPPPVEEQAPVIEEKKPEKPSNRFSIAVDYVPETPKMDVPKADYLIPAFARPDYQPAPPPVAEPTTPVVEQPVVQEPMVETMENVVAPAEYTEPIAENREKEADPFAFFGLPDTMPVSQYQKTPLTETPVAAPVQHISPVPEEPELEPQAPVVQPVAAQLSEPVYEQPAPQWAEQEVYQQPLVQEQAAVNPPVESVPQNLFGAVETINQTASPVESIPGFAAIPGFGAPSEAQQPQNTWAPPVIPEEPLVVETPYVAAPITEPTIQPPVEVVTYNEPTPATEPVAAPTTETIAPVEPEPPVVAPKAPLRFVDPKPVEEKKPVDDDDEELPPPPVVPLPPKRGLFSKKPKTIDRFHNEDGGLK